MSAAQPIWAQDAFLRAFWVATSEPPEWIATRTHALLCKLQTAFDIAYWKIVDGPRWEGPPDFLTDVVRASVVVDPDWPDCAFLGEGYSFTVSGAGPRIRMHVRIAAGSVTVGRRHPSHRLTIELRELVPGAVTGIVGNTICEATIETWEPSTLSLYDHRVPRLDRRGGWKIASGYRVWIHAAVGAVKHIEDGLTANAFPAGTLLAAPDQWPAERVIAAITATLAANGLDEVPH